MVKARKNKRQAWDSQSVMSEQQATVCSCTKCGETFIEPIELTVRAGDSVEKYPACPHCFSRLSDSDNSKKRLKEALLRASAKAEKETVKDIEKEKEPVEDSEKEKPLGCIHFLGYLKTRPKGSPIPDECLTCVSIMQCMGFVGR